MKPDQALHLLSPRTDNPAFELTVAIHHVPIAMADQAIAAAKAIDGEPKELIGIAAKALELLRNLHLAIGEWFDASDRWPTEDLDCHLYAAKDFLDGKTEDGA